MNRSIGNTVIYMMTVRPLLGGEAVFSDETPAFRTPFEPKAGGKVTIRIRTEEAGADAVYLVSRFQRVPMTLAETVNGFDYYEVTVQLGSDRFFYHFEIELGGYTVCYNKGGLSDVLTRDSEFLVIPGFRVPEWARGAVMYQIFPDRFCNGDPSNDVVTGECTYLNRPIEHVGDWLAPPAGFDVGRFYGGDLKGVLKKLDYLKDLGIEAIYFNPLFVSPSNHKYDAQDYSHIDPHFGVIVRDLDDGNEAAGEASQKDERYRVRTTSPENLEASDRLFAQVVEEAHKRGIRVIIDGVFNHCGSFNRWLDREGLYLNREEADGPESEPAGDADEETGGKDIGAYWSADSRYRSFFKFSGEDWPENDSYEGWWDHETLPKLNYDESRELIGEIMKVAVKWITPPYNADGWRLDVAADLGHTPGFNHAFWQMFRKAVREADPETYILAEHYGDPGDHLQGDEWDTVMNFDAFMDPVTYYLTGMEKHSDAYHPSLMADGRLFFDTMRDRMKAFTGPSLMSAMNELDNHDHSRFLTRTNHKVGRVDELGTAAAGENVSFPVMRLGTVMQMTWIGSPTVYYGDEAGVPGFTDPDSRRTYPWGYENKELLAFYKAIIAMRHAWPVLRDGSLIELCESGPAIAYGRFDRESQVFVVVNAGSEAQGLDVPVWLLGLSREIEYSFELLISTDEDGYEAPDKADDKKGGNARFICADGIMPVEVSPHAALVFGRREAKSE